MIPEIRMTLAAQSQGAKLVRATSAVRIRELASGWNCTRGETGDRDPATFVGAAMSAPEPAYETMIGRAGPGFGEGTGCRGPDISGDPSLATSAIPPLYVTG